jgi:hypothetical protein
LRLETINSADPHERIPQKWDWRERNARNIEVRAFRRRPDPSTGQAPEAEPEDMLRRDCLMRAVLQTGDGKWDKTLDGKTT